MLSSSCSCYCGVIFCFFPVLLLSSFSCHHTSRQDFVLLIFPLMFPNPRRLIFWRFFPCALNRYQHFNPIQTQLFHVLYHSDESVLLGAPTGSGKTAVAEIAIMRMLNEHPEAKVLLFFVVGLLLLLLVVLLLVLVLLLLLLLLLPVAGGCGGGRVCVCFRKPPGIFVFILEGFPLSPRTPCHRPVTLLSDAVSPSF